MRKAISIIMVSILSNILLLSSSFANNKSELIPGPVDATLVRVIDGDTIIVRAHIWLGQEVETRVRFAGLDAPEIKGHCEYETKLAHEATNFVKEKLSSGSTILYNIGYDKYAGRVVAKVFNTNGEDVTQALLDAGLAKKYDGKKRKPWCDSSL